MRVLIVEDDVIIRSIHKGILLGFTQEIYEADNYEDALKIIKNTKIDLLLLDIGLSGTKNGLDLLKSTKQKDLYVIVISDTGKNIESYDTGCDDYLPKPFNPEELKRKICVYMKRICKNLSSIVLDDHFYLDDDYKKVVCIGSELTLGKKEYDFLYLMISNKGIVLHKDFIYLKVWGDNDDGSRKLDVLISRIKAKVPYLKTRIESYAKFGYVIR